MGEWRFDGIAGRPSVWAVAYFIGSLAFAGLTAALLAHTSIG
jgi:hypothetical protein